VVLEAPEPDSHIALFDVRAASADLAAAAAWTAYKPDAKRPLKIATPQRARKGWEERCDFDYETSPNERAVVFAIAQRHGDLWTVLVCDMAAPTFGKRLAGMLLVRDSLRPKGYVRETFAGRKAHPLDKDRVKQITDFVEASRQAAGVPGVGIALVEGEKVVFEGGFGVRELGKPARVDKDTQFAVASFTKGMTTLLLARLVDEGKLAWDTPVAKVYPGFKLGDADTTSKVQIKHLVCACTGLPRQDLEWMFEYGKMTPKGSMELLATMRPTSNFGDVFQYSNVLAAAAGWVAGHVLYPDKELGAAYDEAMRKLVFDPLGMKATTFDMARMEKHNHASAHGEDVDGKPSVAKMDMNHAIVPFRPAGGAWSSVHEMSRFIALELSRGVLPGGNRLVSEQNLLARRAPQVTIGEDEVYGMGLAVETGWGVPVVTTHGGLFGYKAIWFAFPEQGVGAILLANADNGRMLERPFSRKVAEVLFDGNPEAADDLAAMVTTHAAAVKKARERLVVPADPAAASKLAARYTSRELGELVVKKQGAATVFDFGEWASTVASRKNDDGTTSFLTIDPVEDGFELVIGERGGKRVLVIRDMQHEYVFTEAG